jgi:hypothetical protein
VDTGEESDDRAVQDDRPLQFVARHGLPHPTRRNSFSNIGISPLVKARPARATPTVEHADILHSS